MYRMCTGSDLYGRTLRLSTSLESCPRPVKAPLVRESTWSCFASRGVGGSSPLVSTDRSQGSLRGIDYAPQRRCRRSGRPGMRAARLADHRQDLGNGRTSRWSYPASTRPSMASSLPASHSGAVARTVSAAHGPPWLQLARSHSGAARSRRAHGPPWLGACPRPTAVRHPGGERSLRAHGPPWPAACPRPTAAPDTGRLAGTAAFHARHGSIASTRHVECHRAQDQRRGRESGHGHGPEREQRRSSGEPHRSRFRAHDPSLHSGTDL